MKSLALLTVALLGLSLQQDGLRRYRDGNGDRLKNAREGKAPPSFSAKSWANTPGKKPLTWKGLKGKVVLLDLWAHW